MHAVNRRLGSRLPVTLVLLGLLCVAACGDGDDGTPLAAPSPSPTIAVGEITVMHTSTARRPVPADVTRFRFIGRGNSDQVLFGRERPKAATIELEDVPLDVVTLQIDYLTMGGDPVAVFRTSVSLASGEASVVDPSYVDLDDPVVFSSSPSGAIASPTTSSRTTARAPPTSGS